MSNPEKVVAGKGRADDEGASAHAGLQRLALLAGSSVPSVHHPKPRPLDLPQAVHRIGAAAGSASWIPPPGDVRGPHMPSSAAVEEPAWLAAINANLRGLPEFPAGPMPDLTQRTDNLSLYNTQYRPQLPAQAAGPVPANSRADEWRRRPDAPTSAGMKRSQTFDDSRHSTHKRRQFDGLSGLEERRHQRGPSPPPSYRPVPMSSNPPPLNQAPLSEEEVRQWQMYGIPPASPLTASAPMQRRFTQGMAPPTAHIMGRAPSNWQPTFTAPLMGYNVPGTPRAQPPPTRPAEGHHSRAEGGVLMHRSNTERLDFAGPAAPSMQRVQSAPQPQRSDVVHIFGEPHKVQCDVANRARAAFEEALSDAGLTWHVPFESDANPSQVLFHRTAERAESVQVYRVHKAAGLSGKLVVIADKLNKHFSGLNMS